MKETVKIYEAESEVADKLLQFADDPRRARDTYDTINLEGFMQDFNKRILYPRNVGDTKAFKSLTRCLGTPVRNQFRHYGIQTKRFYAYL